MRRYFTYIAQCSDKSLYTGYCADLKERQAAHNAGQGARYTRSRRPIRIVYSEAFETKGKAMRKEWEIKQLDRVEKQRLIKEWKKISNAARM